MVNHTSLKVTQNLKLLLKPQTKLLMMSRIAHKVSEKLTTLYS